MNNSDQETENSLELNKIYEPFKPRTQTSKTKNYYGRPAPVDLQLEEIPDINKLHFEGNVIYEWNLHGLTKYQNFQFCNHLMVYENACLMFSNSQHRIITAIISGLTGQLFGWWYDYLS